MSSARIGERVVRIVASALLSVFAAMKIARGYDPSAILIGPVFYTAVAAELAIALVWLSRWWRLSAISSIGLAVGGTLLQVISKHSCGCLGFRWQLSTGQHAIIAGSVALLGLLGLLCVANDAPTSGTSARLS